MQPKLKFEKNFRKDLYSLNAFIHDAKYDNGRSLNWAVLKHYPELKQYIDNKNFKLTDKKSAEKFVTSVFDRNNDILKRNLKIYNENWKRTGTVFFQLTEKIFGNHKWPKGKYIAYPTIWGMFPRFLEDKTFQVPYKWNDKKYVNVIIAHEMLHFIFYDYLFKYFPKYKKSKYNFFIWNVSEIFNELVQNSPRWLKVFKVKSMGYPEHRKIVKKLSKKYHQMESWQTKQLIEDIIKGANDK